MIPSYSSPIEQNYFFAKKALTYTLKALSLGSSNSLNSKVKLHEIIQMREKTDKEFYKMIAALDEAKFNEKTVKEMHYLFKVKYSRIYKMGNCGEHALVALHYLRKHQKSSLAEFVCMTNADHNFIVIGRDPKSSLTDSSSWKSAVICDPWAHQIYPASELPSRLKKICKLNYVEIEGNTPSVEIYTKVNFPSKKIPTKDYSFEAEEEMQVSVRNLFK
ncbi:MAG: hypothetical protein JSS09_03390 [Verrucomicrobia bacterium]|nr:hypothetical protein [Verrucomicrobiota bacterium]